MNTTRNLVLLVLLLLATTVQAINLVWDANPEPEVVGYNIYYAPAVTNQVIVTNAPLVAGGPVTYSTNQVYTNGAWQLEGTTTLTTFKIPDTRSGRVYYALTAFDAQGLNSPMSDTVMAVILGKPRRIRLSFVESRSLNGPFTELTNLYSFVDLPSASESKFYKGRIDFVE